jgi:hypothetical protein
MSEIHLKDKRSTKANGQLIYQKAAEQQELAAVHDKAAADKLEIGDLEAAAHHASLARSYAEQAKYEVNRAPHQHDIARQSKRAA